MLDENLLSNKAQMKRRIKWKKIILNVDNKYKQVVGFTLRRF
jgi:hypothetical protein